MRFEWVTVELQYRHGIEYDLTFHKFFGMFKRRYRFIVVENDRSKGLWCDYDRHLYVLDAEHVKMLNDALEKAIAEQMKNDKPVIPGVDDDSRYL